MAEIIGGFIMLWVIITLGAAFIAGVQKGARKGEQIRMRKINPEAALRLHEMELQRERDKAEEVGRQKAERRAKGVEVARWLLKKGQP